MAGVHSILCAVCQTSLLVGCGHCLPVMSISLQPVQIDAAPTQFSALLSG